jgi:hemolysin D
MVIVPSDAPLVAEVQIDNKDIGFVHAGQQAEIKLEAFNFTRYGTLSAVVQWIAADAVATGQRIDGANAKVQADNTTLMGQAIFPARLLLARNVIKIDEKVLTLSAGLTMTAEIKTGRRRVAEYLLSPLRAQTSESIRER